MFVKFEHDNCNNNNNNKHLPLSAGRSAAPFRLEAVVSSANHLLDWPAASRCPELDQSRSPFKKASAIYLEEEEAKEKGAGNGLAPAQGRFAAHLNGLLAS